MGGGLLEFSFKDGIENKDLNMSKLSKYVAHSPLADGTIPYTAEENKVWEKLYRRQEKIIVNRACDEFIEGLEKLNLSKTRIPQPTEVSDALMRETGWAVEPVEAVIPAKEFFTLLANKKFPAASFIRTFDEIDYLQEPDIFHEVFGHCPLLTNQHYADFVEKYGKLALEATPQQRKFLFRVFWFTVEFGLIATREGHKVYGGGILSSFKETISALDHENGAKYCNFTIQQALRTPFIINKVQNLYFVIHSFKEMHNILDRDIMPLIDEAIELGDYPPSFDYNPEDKDARYN